RTAAAHPPRRIRPTSDISVAKSAGLSAKAESRIPGEGRFSAIKVEPQVSAESSLGKLTSATLHQPANLVAPTA
ncbi:MAG: hypothetical protein WB586_20000, partial [Chthoniobacterales bacterium]